jgi:hypothetical protein
MDFLTECSTKWKSVILVAGNHEYYQSVRGKKTVEEIQRLLDEGCKALGNVHFLNKNSLEIDGVRFLGTTLWSQIPVKSMRTVSSSMNDYRKIFTQRGDLHYSKRHPGGWNTLTVDLTVLWHDDQVAWLEEEIPKSTLPTVIVTHHAPHPNHLTDKDEPTNPAYATDLTRLMKSPVVCWISGHTHKAISFIPEGTNVLCASNPKGYPSQSLARYDARKYITVDQDKSYLCGAINQAQLSDIPTTKKKELTTDGNDRKSPEPLAN